MKRLLRTLENGLISLSRWWWQGMRQHSKASLRDEVEALEKIRQQHWR